MNFAVVVRGIDIVKSRDRAVRRGESARSRIRLPARSKVKVTTDEVSPSFKDELTMLTATGTCPVAVENNNLSQSH